jgi:hypothetical protein
MVTSTTYAGVGTAVLSDSTEQLDTDGDDPYTIHGVAIGEGDVTYGQSETKKYWPAETLRAAASTLEGEPLVKNHTNNADGRIGTVTKSQYQPGVGVLYEAEIAPHYEQLARDVASGILEVSPRIYHRKPEQLEEDDDTGALVVDTARFDNLSVVADGASPSNTAMFGESPKLSPDAGIVNAATASASQGTDGNIVTAVLSREVELPDGDAVADTLTVSTSDVDDTTSQPAQMNTDSSDPQYSQGDWVKWDTRNSTETGTVVGSYMAGDDLPNFRGSRGLDPEGDEILYALRMYKQRDGSWHPIEGDPIGHYEDSLRSTETPSDVADSYVELADWTGSTREVQSVAMLASEPRVNRPMDGERRATFHTPLPERTTDDAVMEAVSVAEDELGMDISVSMSDAGVFVEPIPDTGVGPIEFMHPHLDVIESAFDNQTDITQRSTLFIGGDAVGYSMQPCFMMDERLSDDTLDDIARLYKFVTGVSSNPYYAENRLYLDTGQNQLAHANLDVAELLVRRAADDAGIGIQSHSFKILEETTSELGRSNHEQYDVGAEEWVQWYPSDTTEEHGFALDVDDDMVTIEVWTQNSDGEWETDGEEITKDMEAVEPWGNFPRKQEEFADAIEDGDPRKKPAQGAERQEGSEENDEGSAASMATASLESIEFSESITNGLKNKVEEHNSEHGDEEGKKVTLPMLKKVYRRGAGAYSDSHREGMSRQQWSYARVNAFLYLVRNGNPENDAYTQDNDLLPEDHPKYNPDAEQDDADDGDDDSEEEAAQADPAPWVTAEFAESGPFQDMEGAPDFKNSPSWEDGQMVQWQVRPSLFGQIDHVDWERHVVMVDIHDTVDGELHSTGMTISAGYGDVVPYDGDAMGEELSYHYEEEEDSEASQYAEIPDGHIFDNRSDAEDKAEEMGIEGAHEMPDGKWMPGETHGMYAKAVEEMASALAGVAAELSMSGHPVAWEDTMGGDLDESEIPSEGYEDHYVFAAETKSESSYPLVDAEGNLRRGNVDAAWNLRGNIDDDEYEMSLESFEELLLHLNEYFDDRPIDPSNAMEADPSEYMDDDDDEMSSGVPDPHVVIAELAEMTGSMDELDEVYAEWDDHVNMTASQLESWREHPCSDKASIDTEAVIDRNMRLLETNKSDWDEDDIADAKRTISFISRMSDSANEPEDLRDGPSGCPSEWAISLLNWAHNPFDSMPEVPEALQGDAENARGSPTLMIAELADVSDEYRFDNPGEAVSKAQEMGFDEDSEMSGDELIHTHGDGADTVFMPGPSHDALLEMLDMAEDNAHGTVAGDVSQSTASTGSDVDGVTDAGGAIPSRPIAVASLASTGSATRSVATVDRASNPTTSASTMKELTYDSADEDALAELSEPVVVEREELDSLHADASRAETVDEELTDLNETIEELSATTETLEDIDGDAVEELRETDDPEIVEAEELAAKRELIDEVTEIYAEELAAVDGMALSAEKLAEKFAPSELKEMYDEQADAELASGEIDADDEPEPEGGAVETEELESGADDDGVDTDKARALVADELRSAGWASQAEKIEDGELPVEPYLED